MIRQVTKLRIVMTGVAAFAVAAALVSGAVAAFPQDNVKLYTGCLTSGGTLVNVAEGDNPTQACASPRQVVKLSGGDITSLSVTAPLTGGGTNGAISIGLDASATLPTCSANNAVPKWNLSTSRWTCGTDNDTTYSAGTGLDLSASNEFSINPSYRVKNTPDCSSGNFATGFDDSGNIQCAAPPATSGSAVRITYKPSYTFAGEDFEKILSTSLPPGTYALTARADLEAFNFSSGVTLWTTACEIRDGSTLLGGSEDETYETDVEFGVNRKRTLNVIGVISVPSGGEDVSLWCRNDGSTEGTLGTYGADLMSVKLGGTF